MAHMRELDYKPSTLNGSGQILLGLRHGLLALLLLNILCNVWPPQPWPEDPDKSKAVAASGEKTQAGAVDGLNTTGPPLGATDKLNEGFTTLFRSGSGEGDEKRKDKLSNAVETIKSVSPAKVKMRNFRFLSLSNLAMETDESGMARVDVFEITIANPPAGEVDPIP
jgi:hypothetical protein